MSTMNEPTFACSDAWKQWWKEPSLRAKILDSFEKVVIVLLFSNFLVAISGAIITAFQDGRSVFIGDLMLLVTEFLMVFFVLIRRSANSLSMRPADWGLAFGATCMSLLARPHEGPGHVWDSLAVMLTVTGLSMQLYAKVTLGRRFGIVPANRGICVAGPYRFVRHPIYFGYVILHLGFFMLNPTMWNFAVFSIFYSLKIPRILAEERLLGQDTNYRSYMDRVRFRLIPGLF